MRKLWYILLLITLGISFNSTKAEAWLNGPRKGKKLEQLVEDPSIGTHAAMSKKSIDYFVSQPTTPVPNYQWILDNLNHVYLGSTSTDDTNIAKKIGIPSNPREQHIYFSKNRETIDDSAAQQAAKSQARAINYLRKRDYENFLQEIGRIFHLFQDLANPAHVMGASSRHGSETERFHIGIELLVEKYAHRGFYSKKEPGFKGIFKDIKIRYPIPKPMSAYECAIAIASEVDFGNKEYSILPCSDMVKLCPKTFASKRDPNWTKKNAKFLGSIKSSIELSIAYCVAYLNYLDEKVGLGQGMQTPPIYLFPRWVPIPKLGISTPSQPYFSPIASINKKKTALKIRSKSILGR